MTGLILRLFIPDSKSPHLPKTRTAIGRLGGIVGVICNILLFILKMTVGMLSGALSIIADAMNNISDAFSSIITLIGFKLAEKPADENHPYGHARFEYLSGLAVAGIIIIIGFELAKTSVKKIIAPTPIEISLPILIILVASILIKLWLMVFNKKLGKLISSQTLIATGTDSRNDAISTSAVLVAATLETVTSWRVDGIMGLLVALFILYSGAKMAKETISPLLGENANHELRSMIIDSVTSHPKVLGYHDLMVHDYGPGQRFASIHVEMDYREDSLTCHEIIDNLERQCLKENNVHLVIHYDPIVTDNEELNELKQKISSILLDIDIRISLHDFRMVRGNTSTNLVFDVILPDDLLTSHKDIKAQLDKQLNQDSAITYYTVITFDSLAFNME